ncbi:MAG TPA: hypothetical protein VKV40_21695 [Ktedonobacteraceae bacterium]|nr:hypothetical protein [Ktedonobacteraceae bacterium]
MATRTTTDSTTAGAIPVDSAAFGRFAGLCALLAAFGGLLYAVSFVILKSAALSALFLLLGGLLTTVLLTSLYSHLRAVSASFSLWAFLLALVGQLGAVIHGGYDLANVLNPQPFSARLASLPSAIDPRGLLTFGLTGLGLLVIARLMGLSQFFPRALSYLGCLLAVLLVALYLGRLILLDPANPLLLGTALLSGFIVGPLWYIWVGCVLLRGQY